MTGIRRNRRTDPVSGEIDLRCRGPRRRHAIRHRLQHLVRHGAAEPRHPRPGHVIRVVDRPRRRAFLDIRARRVRERQRQGFATLVMGIVEHRHRHGFLGLASGEGQRPAGCGVVRPGRGRAVRGRIVHRHRTRRRPAERHREGERCVRGLPRLPHPRP